MGARSIIRQRVPAPCGLERPWGRQGSVSAVTAPALGRVLLSPMPKTSTRSAKRKAPWKKPAPKQSRHTKLSPADKAKARRSAKRAGRPYPNLVDNMRAASAKKRSSGQKKKATKRAASKRSRK